jgi:hypothetical protein
MNLLFYVILVSEVHDMQRINVCLSVSFISETTVWI